MREVVCQFDDYVYAALEDAAERLENSIENIIEFAVIETVTGRKKGDHVKENTEDFSPPASRDLYRKPGMYGKPADIIELSHEEAQRLFQKHRHRY